MRTARVGLIASGLGLLLLAPGSAMAVTGCLFDGSINIASLEAGDDPGTVGNDDDFSGGDLCSGPSSGPHTVEAQSGKNCVLKVFVNSTGRSNGATCLSVGKGVTVEMNGHSITCTSSSCGTAIDVTNSSSGTNNKVILNSGTITGCWTTAVKGTAGSDTTVSDFVVDMAAIGSCSANGVTGIAGELKQVDHTVVSDASGTCIGIHSGTLTRSLARDCGTGIQTGALDLNQVVINNASVAGIEQPQVYGGGTLDLTDVVIQDTPCNFKYGFPAQYTACYDTPPNPFFPVAGVNFWGDIIDD